MIFIDGLHYQQQVYKDIHCALSWLAKNGYIVCHDLLPPSEEFQLIPRVQNLWTGDCWRAWVRLRSEKPDIKMCTVDTDFGCGVIEKGAQDLIDIADIELSWSNFLKHKTKWMNIITIKDFKNLYGDKQ